MPELISKFRFLESGAEAPKGSRFKGTLDASSLVGWFNYTSRDEASDERKENVIDGSFLAYTSHDGAEKTYTHNGWLSNENETAFRKEISISFGKKGAIAWDTVISLENYDLAKKYNIKSVDDWVNAVVKALPRYWKSIGLEPSNMLYWMNYHTNKEHPHIHLTFMEKEQSRTKGKVTEKQLNTFKRYFIEELGLRIKLQEQVGIKSDEYFKEKDSYRKQLMDDIGRNLDKVTSLKDFYRMLPRSGRLQYNSQNMSPYKDKMNYFIEECLQLEGVKDAYDEWKSHVNTLAEAMNDFAGEDIETIVEAEKKKLYTLIGNLILEDYKSHLKFKVKMEVNQVVLKEKENHFELKIPFKNKCILLNKDKIIQKDEQHLSILFDDIDYLTKSYLDKNLNKEDISKIEYMTTKEILDLFNQFFDNKIYSTNIQVPDNESEIKNECVISENDVVKKVDDGIVVLLPDTNSSIFIQNEEYLKNNDGKYLINLSKENYILKEYDKEQMISVGNIDRKTILSYYGDERKGLVESIFNSFRKEKKNYSKPMIQRSRNYRVSYDWNHAFKKKVRTTIDNEISKKAKQLSAYLNDDDKINRQNYDQEIYLKSR